MSPIKYIEYLKPINPDYRWATFDSSPWTPLEKPLDQCRVALISSGGVYLKHQPPFEDFGNDFSFREIPKDVSLPDLVIRHRGYDHTDADADVNCVFPIDRMRELEAEGFIRELAPVNYTFMGIIYKRSGLLQEMAPVLAGRLKEGKVDLAFLVPA